MKRWHLSKSMFLAVIGALLLTSCKKVYTFDISSLAPPLKFFSLLIDMVSNLPFLPRDTYILSGYLQPQSASGNFLVQVRYLFSRI